MDKLLCTYHRIFENLILNIMKILTDKDREIQQKQKENHRAVENMLLQSKDNVETNKKLQNALTAAQYQIEAFNSIENRLQMEVRHLR